MTWTTADARRRVALIERQVSRRLTENERTELRLLTERLRAEVRPMFAEMIERAEQALGDAKGRADR